VELRCEDVSVLIENTLLDGSHPARLGGLLITNALLDEEDGVLERPTCRRRTEASEERIVSDAFGEGHSPELGSERPHEARLPGAYRTDDHNVRSRRERSPIYRIQWRDGHPLLGFFVWRKQGFLRIVPPLRHRRAVGG
jgi:hypothetical protein